MTITFDVDDLAARLPEFLAEVEAGHQILIARGSEPLAHVVKAEKPTFTSQKAIDARSAFVIPCSARSASSALTSVSIAGVSAASRSNSRTELTIRHAPGEALVVVALGACG